MTDAQLNIILARIDKIEATLAAIIDNQHRPVFAVTPGPVTGFDAETTRPTPLWPAPRWDAQPPGPGSPVVSMLLGDCTR